MKTEESRFPQLPERLSGLAHLAGNLSWSWRPRARMLFKMLDRQVCKERGHNPDKMLRELAPKFLTAAASNPEYMGFNRKDTGCGVMADALLVENQADRRHSGTVPQALGGRSGQPFGHAFRRRNVGSFGADHRLCPPHLVHGVDAWLNNPIPPMEVSGTGGMKAAVNGVPHLSLRGMAVDVVAIESAYLTQ